MEEVFRVLAGNLALTIEIGAVLIVACGAAEAFVATAGTLTRSATHGRKKEIWRRFGTWLLLGLEFELAADIIRSVIAPTWAEIGQLGAIAVIRTFLNYVLEKDLEASVEAQEQTGEERPQKRGDESSRPAWGRP